jgi:iron complex transport system ATP-binding protein
MSARAGRRGQAHARRRHRGGDVDYRERGGDFRSDWLGGTHGAAHFAYTVLDLVVMGRTAYLDAYKSPRREDYEAAREALNRLGISALADRDSTRISGGQRQLTLIARALAQQSSVIVMDEPTASLDFGNRILVLKTIRALATNGCAVVLSTHEPEHVFEVADEVAAFGPGNHFVAGLVERVLTAGELSEIYGVALKVEKTPSGRVVVSQA